MSLFSKVLAIASLVISVSASARDFTAAECPVVGNTKSHIYHVAGGQFFEMMLIENHGSDNRKCFQTESDAQKAGFRKSKR